MKLIESVLECRRAVAGTVVTLLLLVAAPAVWADTVSTNAVDWIITQQSQSEPTAGAFEWDPATEKYYANTQGATALGVLRVYERTGYAKALNSAIANGQCQLDGDACISGYEYADGDHRFATHDALFLIELSRVTGNPQYATLVDSDLWSKFASGTYGADDNQTAADFAADVLSIRGTIAAFDLSKMALAAQLAGRHGMAVSFMEAIQDSLELATASNDTYDMHSLASAVRAAAATGFDLNPATGTWASADSTAELAAMLASHQAPNGGFVYDASVDVTNANVGPQITALAMLALNGVDPVAYQSAVVNGFAYLAGMQNADGHFGTVYVESQGEIMEAYAIIVLAPGDVYVDDDYAGDAFGTSESFTHSMVNGGTPITVTFGRDGFATIAAALDEVATDGTVYIAPGTYDEGDQSSGSNLHIGNPVTLLGAQAGVDARTRALAAATETVVLPAHAASQLAEDPWRGAVISIAASNVTIDGLVVDADNPDIATGALALNGADPDVGQDLYASGNHVVIRNSVFRNAGYAGIAAQASSGASGGNVISRNRFTNITAPATWGRGIIVYNNFYAQITDNLMDQVLIGVQTNNFSQAAPSGFAPEFSGNEVHAALTGVFHNLFYANATAWTIANNQIIAAANPDVDGAWYGIWVESMGGSQTVTVTGNTIDASALGAARASAGYVLNNITSAASSTTAIDGGTVTGVDAGVLATDAVSYEGPVNDFLVKNVQFSDVAIAAFYVEDSNEAAGSAKLTIGDGNSYGANVAHVLALSGTAPSVGFAGAQTGVTDVLVRSARDYFRGGTNYISCTSSLCTVDNASINAGIDYASAGGTVHVEAGSFDERVKVRKSLALLGPQAGVPGYDAARGSGEAILTNSDTSSYSRVLSIIGASDVTVDGLTFKNTQGNAITSGWAHQGGSDSVSIVNNRFMDIQSDSAIYTNGTNLSNWTVSHNYIDNVVSSVGSGINLWKMAGGTISDNVIKNIGWSAIQVVGSSDIQISGNTIANTGSLGMNIGGATNVQVFGNAVTNANTDAHAGLGAITVGQGLPSDGSPDSSNVVVFCNAISGSGSNGITSLLDAAAGIRIFDNAITVSNSLAHDGAATLAIGSNWYGGAAPTVGGSNAAGLMVAAPLPATPIGTGVCSNPDPATANDPAQLVVARGTPQTTNVNSAFAQPLVVRVEDALGGAVMGQSVSFSAPAGGASAALAPVSGSSNYNGIVSTTAMANGVGGSYQVSANSASLAPVAFELTNRRLNGGIAWDSLTWVYDGNAHAPTAHLNEQSPSVCTVTPAMIGPNAGSYPVHVECVSDSYVASGDATASITPAPAAVTLSNFSQAYDGSPKAVTVVTDPAGVAVSVVYDGSSTPPTAVGDHAVVATVTDPNYTGSASGTLHITEGPLTDIAASIDDRRDYAQYGYLLSYLITVSNVGNQDVTGVSVNDVLPATLVAVGWECVAVGNAVCSDSGSLGDLHTTVDLPADSSVVIVLDGLVKDDQSLTTDVIQNGVTITAPGDTNAANDTASDVTHAVIFRDGFELNGNGAQVIGLTMVAGEGARLTARNSQVLDLRPVWQAAGGAIVPLGRLTSDRGDTVRIQALRAAAGLRVRMVGQVAGQPQLTHWVSIEPSAATLAVGLVVSGDDSVLLLVGANAELQMRLGDGASMMQLRGPAVSGE